ncbi:MAG: putative membrane protein SirB2 [Alphaproteobacteria bacterium]|jgi:uncharacterized membrane protein SirB2
MYEIVKNAHITIILLTVVVFLISFVLTIKISDKVNNKLLKIGPHILYTLFIITFLYMVGHRVSNELPLSYSWAFSKLGGFVFYVLSITLALKWAKKNIWRFVGLISAIFWLVMSVRLGYSKALMVKIASNNTNSYIEVAQSYALAIC